jgi:fused signal recognition particle receptor
VAQSALLWLSIAAVLLIVGIGALLYAGSRRSRALPPAPGAEPPAPIPGSGGATGGDPGSSGASPAAAPGDGAESGGAAAPVVVLERPDPVAGRMVRLRARLAGSGSRLGQGLLQLLSRETVDAATWEEVEETLLLADLGTEPTEAVVASLRSKVAVLGTRDEAQLRALLREELLAAVEPDLDRSLAVSRHEDPDGGPGRPAVVLVVGVNGTGKTTTVGKLARVLVAQDKDVVLGAADTFRAAAAQQLATWGDKVGVPTVRSDRDGGDPAAVAYDAVAAGIATEADVVLIDTAGRLQNKVGLMDELGKVKRVIEKHGPVDEVLLVLDATTGQNGLQQARVFGEVVDVTGIVLTKLDGTAKGGIVVAVQRSLGVPVKLVGLGEGPDDLAPFDPEVFVDALIAERSSARARRHLPVTAAGRRRNTPPGSWTADGAPMPRCRTTTRPGPARPRPPVRPFPKGYGC